MHLLYFLLAGTMLSFLLNSPILGLAVAAIVISWLAYIAWINRHMPYDPRDY